MPMHPDSKTRLAEHLQHMLEHGPALHMLFMRVRATVDGMLAGCENGEMELDYPCARVMDFARCGEFLAFCRRNNLKVGRGRWGNELVYRASIGADIANAVALIGQCFHDVYGHAGPFALDLKGDGWQPGAGASETASRRVA